MRGILLLIALAAAAGALELDLAEWQQVREARDGEWTTTVVNRRESDGAFDVVHAVVVRRRGHAFHFDQTITVSIGSDLLADATIAYDRNGHYLTQFLVMRAAWLCSYGRLLERGPDQDEECIIVREPATGPSPGRSLVLIRRNGLFVVRRPARGGS